MKRRQRVKHTATFRTFRAALRDDFRSDHTGLAPQPTRWWHHLAVWAGILALYAAGFGIGVRNALHALIQLLNGHPLRAPASATVAENIRSLLWVLVDAGVAAAALVAILLLLRRQPRPQFRWKTIGQSTTLGAVAVAAGFCTVELVEASTGWPSNSFPIPTHPDALTRTADLASAFIAGPSEEFLLLGLVVVALRTTGYPWYAVFLTAALLRVPFHLYYGPSAIAIAVWPLLMVLLVRRLGLWAVLGATIEHSLWDISGHLPEVANWTVKGILIAGAIPFYVRWSNGIQQIADHAALTTTTSRTG